MITYGQEEKRFFVVLRVLTGMMGVLTALAVGILFWVLYCGVV